MEEDILVKHFNNFVPNKILNIKQTFPIILKDKELQKMLMAS